MTSPRILPRAFVALVLIGLKGAWLSAQSTSPPLDPQLATANQALHTCLDLIGRAQIADAQTPARRAEASFSRYLKRRPRDVDAMVGLARTMSQCTLPAATFMEQGEISTTAVELLQGAIEIDPANWTARFVLASILYASPPFMRRSERAAQQYDELLARQGSRTDSPAFALVFQNRGRLFRAAGHPDSALSVWKRGAALFPGDSALHALIRSTERASPPKPGAGRAASADRIASGASAPGQPPTVATSDSTAAVPIARATDLEPVRVVASALSDGSTLPSQSIVSRSQILLSAGAGADVLQAVQLQPGATRVSEGADVYTRGGDPSETSLLINGARLMSIARFEGLNGSMFGALEPWVVKSVRYSSGGFSARYGNALSGVLEIETDGRPTERSYRTGLSLVQASGTARAPMGKRVGAWISGRAANTSLLLATHGRSAEFDGAPHSEELVGSIVALPSPSSEVRATVLLEQDDSRRIVSSVGWTGPFHSAASSRSLVVSSRWLSASLPVMVRSSVQAGTRSTDWGFGVLARARTEGSVGSRLDAEWSPEGALWIHAGVEQGALTRLENGALPTMSNVAPGSPIRSVQDDRSSAREIGAYGEAQLERAGTALMVGIRSDQLPGEDRVTVDPRIALTSGFGAWNAKLSGGLFHQGRYRADAAIPDAGQPSGSPTAARHLVAGLERDNAAILLRAEAYLKAYSQYARFGAGPQIDHGSARGLDLLAQRKSGARVTGWVSYSLLDARVQLEDGRIVRSPADVTSSATGSATLTLTEDWSVGSTLRYGTGVPITPITSGRVDAEGRTVPVYGASMSERMPAYARLDARLMRYVRMPAFLLSAFLEVMNLTDRRNASSLAYDATYSSHTEIPSFFASRTLVVGGEFQFR